MTEEGRKRFRVVFATGAYIVQAENESDAENLASYILTEDCETGIGLAGVLKATITRLDDE